MPSKRVASGPVERGWAQLQESQWDAARRSFSEALSNETTPEALEGLSWAAWWLDDSEALFDSRARAYRLYRKRGNATAAARMATWLAVDQLDFRGAAAVSNGWLQRAHRLLDGTDPGPDHGWLAFHEGYIAHGRGDAVHARELGRTAAQLGRQFGVPDLEMLGLALEGSALVAAAQVEEGMRCLDEATVTALEEEATIPISSAWTSCFLVSACTVVLDFERASEWCDRIAEFASRHGSRYMLAFCRAEYGAVDLWRGRWAEAEKLLEASVEDYAVSRPPWVGSPLALLAELKRRQGRHEEARALLDKAGPTQAAQLCRARLVLDDGDARQAVELAERLLRQLPAARRLDRIPALELLVSARVAGGGLDEADVALAELHGIERLVGTSPLRAVADRSEALVCEARGDHDRARTLLEDAVDRFERSNAPYEAAQSRLQLAASLAALGRTEQADRETATATRSLAELSAAGQPVSPPTPVTAREREVLMLLAEGLTNRQIAERLVVSEHTVHRHVANILRKLRLPSRAAAAAYAARTGLLEDA